MGKINTLMKSELFPCLKAKEKHGTIKSSFLCYAKPQNKRLFLLRKKVKFKRYHMEKAYLLK